MAFTEAEKVKIRNYLGRGIMNKQLDPRLESAMLACNSDEEDRARVYLERLRKIEVRLVGDDDDADAGGALDNLDLVKAEDVTFAGEAQLESLRRVGRQIVRALSILFHTEATSDYFAPDAYAGASGGFIALG